MYEISFHSEDLRRKKLKENSMNEKKAKKLLNFHRADLELDRNNIDRALMMMRNFSSTANDDFKQVKIFQCKKK